MGVESLHLMAKREGHRNRIELLQGTLDMLILRTLSWGPQHGYGIGQAIRAGSGEVLQAETGSLYPALHRLEKQKWVRAEWRQSENRQRARYYSLTPSGRKQLAAERFRWKQMSAAIASLMEPKGSEG
jgi:PadR family transcriptional regulator PadR